MKWYNKSKKKNMSDDINSKEILRRLVLDPQNAAVHAAKLLLLDKKLSEEGIIEDDRKGRLIDAFAENWQNWMGCLPSDEQIDEGIAWWCFTHLKVFLFTIFI